MRALFVLLALSCAVGVTLCDTYTSKFDNIDIDEILKSDRLLDNYIKCLLDQGPCTPDGAELKKNLPEAIENDCAKCTEKQKQNNDKVLNYLIDNKNDKYLTVEAKYDPEGKYRKRYMDAKGK